MICGAKPPKGDVQPYAGDLMKRAEQTKKIMRKNFGSILFWTYLFSAVVLLSALSEYYAYRFAESETVKNMIFSVFFLTDVFFVYPLFLGVIRKTMFYIEERRSFALVFLNNMKTVIFTALSAVFAFIPVMLVLSAYVFFTSLSERFFSPLYVKAAAAVIFLILLFALLLKIFYATVKALRAEPERIFFEYINNFSKNKITDILKEIYPCLPRLLSVLLILPWVYALPFTAIFISLEGAENDKNEKQIHTDFTEKIKSR